MLILLTCIPPFCWTAILGSGPLSGRAEASGENPPEYEANVGTEKGPAHGLGPCLPPAQFDRSPLGSKPGGGHYRGTLAQRPEAQAGPKGR